MKLLQKCIAQADYRRNFFVAEPERGVTLADMLVPDFWSHVAKTLKRGDRIDVLPADGSWYAELLVRSAADLEAHVVVLSKVDLDAPQPKAPDTELFEVKHRGGAGWSVVRKADREVMFEKGQTRQEAEAWVESQKEMA